VDLDRSAAAEDVKAGVSLSASLSAGHAITGAAHTPSTRTADAATTPATSAPISSAGSVCWRSASLIMTLALTWCCAGRAANWCCSGSGWAVSPARQQPLPNPLTIHWSVRRWSSDNLPCSEHAGRSARTTRHGFATAHCGSRLGQGPRRSRSPPNTAGANPARTRYPGCFALHSPSATPRATNSYHSTCWTTSLSSPSQSRRCCAEPECSALPALLASRRHAVTPAPDSSPVAAWTAAVGRFTRVHGAPRASNGTTHLIVTLPALVHAVDAGAYRSAMDVVAPARCTSANTDPPPLRSAESNYGSDAT